MGRAGSGQCQFLLDTFMLICDYLGVPLAKAKMESQTSCLTFLGIELDPTAASSWLPKDKLFTVKGLLMAAIHAKKLS